MISGKGYVITHSFFDPSTINRYHPGDLFSPQTLPIPSILLSFIFRLFPATDATVAIAGLSVFALSALLLFLIGRRLHSALAGAIAALLLISNLFFFEYALNFSSDLIFTFEILLFIYLATSSSLFFRSLSLLPFVATFFTRPHAWVFFASLCAYLFYRLFRSKLPLYAKIAIVVTFALLVQQFWSYSYKRTNHNYLPSSFVGSLFIPPQISQGTYLRGDTVKILSLKALFSKTFYNAYNFLKFPDRLTSPAIILLYFLGLFRNRTSKHFFEFGLFTSITFAVFVLASSLSLPNARYVHPVMPLIFVLASMSLLDLLKTNQKSIGAIKLFGVLFFLALPALGHLTIDARFRQQHNNVDRPTTVKVISDRMASHIPQGRLIITNLDAWAAWYHDLTTIWFPVSPDLLINLAVKADFIVITNYLEADSDFAASDWSEVVYSPHELKSGFLKSNYRVLTTFNIDSDEVYENKPIRGTILVSQAYHNVRSN